MLDLKYKNDIESVISSYVSLKRRGSTFVGLCPFHNEKTPSFTVYPESGSYYCFGCGAGGDVISFIRQAENLDYIDAVRHLANRAGIEMPEYGQDSGPGDRNTEIFAVNRETARFFHECLLSEQGRQGLQYLRGRGLNDKFIRRFGMGFAPDSWDQLLDYLKGKGFDEKIIRDADLVRLGRNGRCFDRFRKRVMFPIIDIRGNVIAFSGRALPGEENTAKYINTADTPVYKKSHNIYGLNFAKSSCSERIILVEGNLDVIALHQAGFSNTVAALGTSFTQEQARLLSRYTKEVVITLDSDAAGEKATDRALSILTDMGVRSRILRLPDCKDPDEFIKKHSAAKFQALLDGAVNDIEYRLSAAKDGLDLETDDGRLEYIKNCTKVLAGIQDDIAIDLYAGRLSSEYSVSKEAILLSVKDEKATRRKNRNKRELREIVSPTAKGDDVNPQKRVLLRATKAEETLLSVLMTHPDFYEFVSQRITPEDFVTEFSRRVYEQLQDMFDAGLSFDLSLINEKFTPKETGYISMILVSYAACENIETVLLDSIKVILEEKERIGQKSSEDMSDDEWLSKMKQLVDKKKSN
ncbi:MAG: DNA primase [bacterium]|nr:DNA primase [bacterium]